MVDTFARAYGWGKEELNRWTYQELATLQELIQAREDREREMWRNRMEVIANCLGHQLIG